MTLERLDHLVAHLVQGLTVALALRDGRRPATRTHPSLTPER